ncbi:YhdP family protein [Bacterioplanoides pacificum]|uniref:YhdP family protein n=1 Tax=Bacterioplanoides pacificum TaxID=1171596 RepID=A0ABV7VXY7_9GAMM
MRWLSQLWTQIWITLVVAMVSLALYVSVGRQLIPLVESLRPDVEQQLSAALQQPVSIGSLTGGWHILAPVVTLQDITLGEAESGLHIRKIVAELDLSASAFYQLPVFKRIEVSGVRGHIVQLGKRHWQLADGWQIGQPDLTIDPLTGTTRAAAAIRRPGWLDLLELQQALVLSDWRITHQGLDVNDQLEIHQLLWRNRANSRAIEGQVAWGLEQLARLTVKGTFQGPLWPWTDQDAQFYVAVEPQDWSRWVPGQQQDQFHLQQLSAGLQGWASIRDGDLSSLVASVQVPQLALKTPGEALQLSGGNIQLRANRKGSDWDMRIRPQFDQPLPLQELTVSAAVLEQQKGWQFGIPQLDIAAARELLEKHALLPDNILQYIRQTRPRGQALNTRLSLLPGQDEQPLQLALYSDIHEASSDSYNGIPAFSDISGKLALTPKAGKLTLDDDDFAVQLAGIYADSWRLQNGRGTFYWQINHDAFRLRLADMQAQFNGIDIHADVGLRIPNNADVEPNTSVLAAFRQADAAQRDQLVPELLDPSVRQWISDSILAGQFHNGVFLLNGRLSEQPPSNSNSVQLYFDVSDARLRYLPDWPEVTGLSGRMLLDAPNLDVWVDQGKTLGGRFAERSARIRLRNHNDQPQLQVSGQLIGQADQALRYFTETPLQQQVNGAFDQWQASGELQASMLMKMPLGGDNSVPKVQLDVAVSDAAVELSELKVKLQQLNGTLHFDSELGLSAERLSGSVFGGDFDASIQSQSYQGGFDMALSAKGDAQWPEVKQWMPLFLLDPLTGQLNYQARLDIKSAKRGGLSFQLNSDLSGTTIDMPQPLGKDAQQPRHLALTVRPGAETRITLNYDELMKAALAMDEDGLDRGQVYFGGPDPFLPSDKGVVVRGAIKQPIKAAEWWDQWQHFSALLSNTENDNNAPAPGQTASASHNPLRQIDLQIAGVDSWGIPMGQLRLNASQQWNEWQFNVDSDLVKGLITLKPDGQPIDMQLDYIHMPYKDETAQAVSQAADEVAAEAAEPEKPDPLAALNPADFPAMDMQLAEFYVGSRNYGRWHVSSRPGAQAMKIQLHDSDMKGMQISGDVLWQKQDGLHVTQLDTLEIRSKDVGKVLRSFRQKAIIESSDMRASLKLSWQGSPLMFNSASLNGLASLRLRDGSIDAEGAGALKAFGALNFNSISRRLRLDFSDLYQSGLAFDVLKGKARIEDGLLTLSEPLLVDGPGGKFLTSGSSNLNDHSLDMKLAVTFPVTSSLPMVAVLAGLAPPVAAAIYVSEKLVGDELERFTSASYTVKGRWEQPELKIDQAFNNEVEGKKTRSFKDRVLSIFGIDGDDDD